ncbi:MAG: competence/damage-inducible protein A [Gemmatimonas sp.]|nr:competence/damage-inducible protein A [Gemmatimonas sp.]
MNAAILAIGDEIVSGLTADTNSGFLAQLLRSAGVDTLGFQSVPDDEEAIERALRWALERAELVVTTGGLGPTADDLTTASVARLADVDLELHPPSLRSIERRFRDRGIEMPTNNRKQALMPTGALVLSNPDGTAPGFICAVPGRPGDRHVASLPGVPREMRRMAEESLLPWVVERSTAGRFGARVFSTSGLTESGLDELLAGAIDPSEARLSFRAAFPRLQVRVSVTARSDEEVEARLASLESRVRDRLGDHVYAVGDEGMEETVGKLLLQRGLTIATAESCTGGLIGHRITDVPGSSAYFTLGVIAYSNQAKMDLLGVSSRTLRDYGAVSEETVMEMARGVRRMAASSIGVATSGIAGPGGGTDEKPVGTVWIAISHEDGEWARRYDLGVRSRLWVKEMTAQIALDRVRRSLLQDDR